MEYLIIRDAESENRLKDCDDGTYVYRREHLGLDV